MSRLLKASLFSLLIIFSACEDWEFESVDFLEITTGSIVSVSSNTVTLRGSIEGLTMTVISQHGHCWSNKTETPTIEDDAFSELGIRGGNGSFEATIENLDGNQSYYIRAYAVWEGKVFYGETILFQTNIVIRTDSIQYLAGEEAIGFGTIESFDPQSSAREYGHCWATTNATPTIDDHKVIGDTIFDDGLFYSQISGLPIGLRSFIRSYAIEEGRIIYGNVVSVSTTPANVWAERSPVPEGFRWRGTATFVIADKGYIGAGRRGDQYLRQFWRYDPVFNRWEPAAAFRGSPRAYPFSMAVGGKGYIGTGRMPNSATTNDVWEYDPEKDAWDYAGIFPGGRMEEGIAFSTGEKGYAISRNDNYLYSFHPTSGWTKEASFAAFNQRASAVGFVFENQAFVATGFVRREGEVQDVWTTDLEAYDWRPLPDFNGGTRSKAVGVSTQEKAFIGMGLRDRFTTLSDFWEFDPDAEVWTQKADFGGTLVETVAAFSIGSRVYVHGFDGSFWVYVSK